MNNTNQNSQPETVFYIRDLQTMKVLVSRLRLKVLRLLIAEECTIRQVARGLNIPPNRLYYHFSLLEQCGAIRVVDTRLVAGILEKRYRAAAARYEIESALLQEELALPIR
jgi:DNA-binding transcriptional ArsR family regulator